jgi:hypothetical protein
VAHISEPRVRETSTTEGIITFVLAGAMFGSNRFSQVMAVGDTCDYVISYGDTFEEGVGTLDASGNLERTTVTRSRHANGTTDTNKVSFAAGVKTVIMTVGASRAVTLRTAVRYDTAQSLTTAEKRQALDNLGVFPTGTKLPFQQSSAPTGWTKDTTHNDKALRIVSGTASSGGSLAFSTVFSRTATDSHTLTHAELPNPTLSVSDGRSISVSDTRVWRARSVATAPGSETTAATMANTTAGVVDNQLVSVIAGSITASFSGSAPTVNLGGAGSAHPHGMDIRVQYVDFIIATKD